MDNEMMELMAKMYTEMKEGFAKVNSRIDNLEGKFDGLENRFDSLEAKVDKLENKVDRNTIILEELNDKVKTIAECQVAFAEQLERNNESTNKHINDRMDVMELAITSNAKNKGGNILRIISNGNIDIEMPNNNTI